MFDVGRRTVVLAPVLLGLAYPLVGCTDQPPAPASASPERTALTIALTRERTLQQLAGSWADSSLESAEGSDMVVRVIAIHIAALTRTLGTTASTSSSLAPTGSPSPAPVSVSTAALGVASARASRAHAQALRAVTAPSAQLLGSLAASDASIAEYLATLR